MPLDIYASSRRFIFAVSDIWYLHCHHHQSRHADAIYFFHFYAMTFYMLPLLMIQRRLWAPDWLPSYLELALRCLRAIDYYISAVCRHCAFFYLRQKASSDWCRQRFHYWISSPRRLYWAFLHVFSFSFMPIFCLYATTPASLLIYHVTFRGRLRQMRFATAVFTLSDFFAVCCSKVAATRYHADFWLLWGFLQISPFVIILLMRFLPLRGRWLIFYLRAAAIILRLLFPRRFWFSLPAAPCHLRRALFFFFFFFDASLSCQMPSWALLCRCCHFSIIPPLYLPSFRHAIKSFHCRAMFSPICCQHAAEFSISFFCLSVVMPSFTDFSHWYFIDIVMFISDAASSRHVYITGLPSVVHCIYCVIYIAISHYARSFLFFAA